MSEPADQADWRPRLRRQVGKLLLVKLIALTALWWLFFSPAHRPDIDEDAIGARIAVTETGDARAD